MSKAQDLADLVGRLVALKNSAVAPTEEWAKTFVEGGGKEAKVNGLRVWFFDSTLPTEITFPIRPTRSLGIEVREGTRMDVVFRIHVEENQMVSDFKAAIWKRGLWEQALSYAVQA